MFQMPHLLVSQRIINKLFSNKIFFLKKPMTKEKSLSRNSDKPSPLYILMYGQP